MGWFLLPIIRGILLWRRFPLPFSRGSGFVPGHRGHTGGPPYCGSIVTELFDGFTSRTPAGGSRVTT